MLQRQNVVFQFAQGVDTKSAEPAQQVGRLVELENGVFDKLGQISKRRGYDAISPAVYDASDAVDSAAGVAVFQERELLLFSGRRLYSYSDALSSWVDRGRAVSVLAAERSVVRNTYEQTSPDVATADSLACLAWVDSRGGVRCTVYDTETGTTLLSDASVADVGGLPRVVSYGGAFVVWWARGNNIYYRTISHASPTALGTTVNAIATLDPTTQAFDVAVRGDRISLAFVDTTWALRVTQGASLAAIGATDAVLGPLLATSIAVWIGEGDHTYVLASSSSQQHLYGVDTGYADDPCPDALVSSLEGVTHVALVGLDVSDTGDTLHLLMATSDGVRHVEVMTVPASSPTIVRSAMLARSVGLAARPFVASGDVYVPCVHDSELQATHFVLDLDGRVAAKGTPGAAGGARSGYPLSHSALVSTGVRAFAHEAKGALETRDGVLYARKGVALTTLDFTSTHRHATAEIGNSLLVTGGVLQAYDGARLGEHGFHLFPEGASGTASAVSLDLGETGLTSGKAYQWRVIYERTDRFGQVHRSAPGMVTVDGDDSYTPAATEKVTITIPTLRLTAYDDVRIAVYRTAGDGSIFYRLSPIATPLLNDPDVDDVTFVDTYEDADITANEVLYTTGEVLDNVAPSSCSLITTHRGRAFLAGLSDPSKIAFSKETVPGEAVAFNDALYIASDPQGGEITAVASMDDKLVVFKRTAIFVVFGDGPNNTGLLGEFSSPQLVTSDVGCSEPRSVVATSAGLLFKSPKGIYLLDRSLSTTYVGAPVEAWNGETITSATLVPNTNHVRFTTATGPALVYDYVFNQWSTFTNHQAADAAAWRDRYVYVRSNGRAFVESEDGHTDDGAHVRLRATTAWMQFTGVQGFQRIYRVAFLGDYKSAHRLRVRFGYDFRPEFPQDDTVDVETLVGPSTWGAEATWGAGGAWGGEHPIDEFVMRPVRQKCSAFRVCVEDVADGDPGESLTLSALVLEVGAKRGLNKTRQAVRV